MSFRTDGSDGGPAYPVPNSANVNGEMGMSLRDYFAGQALSSMLSPTRTGDGGSLSINHETYFAKRAYSLADAMLVERGK